VRLLILQSGLFSASLHVSLIALLVVSFNASPPMMLPQPQTNEDVIQAVAIQSDQVEMEIQKLKDIDNEKIKQQQENEKKLEELELQAKQAEDKRKAEEKRLAETTKKKEAEQKERKQEQLKLAEIKKQQEQTELKQKQAEDKVRLAQDARKNEEALTKKAEEDRLRNKEQEEQRLAEVKRKAEEEQKRIEREAALQAQLAEEQRQQEAAQRSQDQQLLQQTVNGIYRRVVGNFNLSGLQPGLQCVLTIRLIPGGDVVNVTIERSSGNDIFDRRAITAVQKATPLPVPQDALTFERLGLRQFNLVFKP
jgi:colicin import membrane protein